MLLCNKKYDYNFFYDCEGTKTVSLPLYLLWRIK